MALESAGSAGGRVRPCVCEDGAARRGPGRRPSGRDLSCCVGRSSEPVLQVTPPGSRSSPPACPALGLPRGLGEAVGVHSEGQP